MKLVRSKSNATHKVQEVQGANVLTGCGLTLPYGPSTQLDHLYPTCQRCARKV